MEQRVRFRMAETSKTGWVEDFKKALQFGQVSESIRIEQSREQDDRLGMLDPTIVNGIIVGGATVLAGIITAFATVFAARHGDKENPKEPTQVVIVNLLGSRGSSQVRVDLSQRTIEADIAKAAENIGQLREISI